MEDEAKKLGDMFKNLINGNPEMMGAIKMRAPVNKLNMDLEDKFHVIGMSMLMDDKLEENLKLDLNDLTDETILFIERHHLQEVVSIIDGLLAIMQHSSIITEDTRMQYIDDLIYYSYGCNNGVQRYSLFKVNLNKIRPLTAVNDLYTSKLTWLTKHIWFAPYSELDRYYDTAVTAYKKDTGKSNENTSKDD